jgi:hypothetical protein
VPPVGCTSMKARTRLTACSMSSGSIMGHGMMPGERPGSLSADDAPGTRLRVRNSRVAVRPRIRAVEGGLGAVQLGSSKPNPATRRQPF